MTAGGCRPTQAGKYTTRTRAYLPKKLKSWSLCSLYTALNASFKEISSLLKLERALASSGRWSGLGNSDSESKCDSLPTSS